jgi:secondary thiamine-phosphate synthase enzyme
MAFREELIVQTKGRGTLELTGRLQEATARAGVQVGTATVFVHHTSASLFVNENADPDVRRDLEAFLSRLVPDGDALYVHTAEGPDDMSAHVRTLLTCTSLTLPVFKGRLDLGTWQGVYLWEHRHAAHRRRVTVTVLG